MNEMVPMFCGILVFTGAVTAAFWCVLFGKAGFSRWLGLLVVGPFVGSVIALVFLYSPLMLISIPFAIVGLVAFLWLVFGEWPVHRELRRLRREKELLETCLRESQVGDVPEVGGRASDIPRLTCRSCGQTFVGGTAEGGLCPLCGEPVSGR
jgi:hypothetical protein